MSEPDHYVISRSDRMYRVHCATCDSPTHNACLTCGRCLPESFTAGHARARIDRVYCSAACRQRCYRIRKATR
jgi:hypothetical protein